MHVAACLQPAKLARLQGAAGDRHRLFVALDWAHAEVIIRRHPVDVLVVDPQFSTGGEPRTDSIRRVRDRFRALPMIVYSVLAAQTLLSLVQLGREGLEQLILYGLDDDPQHIRDALERQPGIQFSEDLLERLRRPIGRVAPAIGTTIERLIRNPAAFHGVPDIVSAAGVPRRSLYRHLERAGFVSPRELLAGARLLRAYAFLRQPAYSLDLVASHLRFTDAEAMANAMKWGVGITPARARDRMSPEDFVERLAARLCPNPGLDGTGAPVGDEGSVRA